MQTTYSANVHYVAQMCVPSTIHYGRCVYHKQQIIRSYFENNCMLGAILHGVGAHCGAHHAMQYMVHSMQLFFNKI